MDAEVTALRQQLVDTKKAHDATIRAFEMSQPDNKQNLGQKEIIEMRENYAREKKVLENELNSLKKSLNLQVLSPKKLYILMHISFTIHIKELFTPMENNKLL